VIHFGKTVPYFTTTDTLFIFPPPSFELANIADWGKERHCTCRSQSVIARGGGLLRWGGLGRKTTWAMSAAADKANDVQASENGGAINIERCCQDPVKVQTIPIPGEFAPDGRNRVSTVRLLIPN
jgi:hypothetical protein